MRGAAVPWALALTAWAGACGSDPVPSLDRLPPIPTPDTEGMEPAVREQLDAARSAWERTAAETSARPSELAAALVALGGTYLTYDLFEPARVAFRNAAALDPGDPTAPYLMGYVAERSGAFEEARRHFERSLSLDDEYEVAWLRLGHVALELGDLQRAGSAYRQAERLRATAAASYGLGRVASDRGDDAAALEHFARALALQPDASRLHYHVASAHRKLGDQDAAARSLALAGTAEVLIDDPRLARITPPAAGSSALATRADQAVKEGRYQEAVRLYRQAAEADSTSYYHLKSLGLTLYAVGQVGPAIEALRDALERDPGGTAEQAARERAVVHYNLAGMLANTGKLEDAQRHFRAVLAVDLDHRDAAFHLARTLGAQGRLDEAAQWLTEVLRISPEDTAALELRATTFMDLGRFQDAIPDLEELLRLAPRHGRARSLLQIARERSSASHVEGELPQAVLVQRPVRPGRLTQRVRLGHVDPEGPGLTGPPRPGSRW